MRDFSRYAASVSLLGLALILLPATSNLGEGSGRWLLSILLAAPPAVMAMFGFRGGSKRWGQWVACLMIPYFALALGEVIAVPGGSPYGLAASLLTAAAFLLALDAQRRRS